MVTLLFTALPLAAVDLSPKVKAVVKPETATVGSVVQYRLNLAGEGLDDITILLPEDREYYPEREDDKKKNDGDEEKKPSESVPLYIIHNAKKNDNSSDTMTDITVVLEISYYRPGKYELPVIEIRGEDTIPIGYEVPVIEIRELNTKGELEQIEPPLELGGNYTRLILLLIGTAVATALGIALFLYLRKRRQEKLDAPLIVPAIELFHKDLKKFKGDKLIEAGKVEEYVFGISQIFRRYLSRQFGFDAMEMTSYEIEKALSHYMAPELLGKYGDRVTKYFDLWDLSKFAEFTPSREILMENLKNTGKTAEELHEDLHGSGEDDGTA